MSLVKWFYCHLRAIAYTEIYFAIGVGQKNIYLIGEDLKVQQSLNLVNSVEGRVFVIRYGIISSPTNEKHN